MTPEFVFRILHWTAIFVTVVVVNAVPDHMWGAIAAQTLFLLGLTTGDLIGQWRKAVRR